MRPDLFAFACAPKPSDTITVIEGFDTMRGSFWRRFGQRQGKAEDIASILGRSNMGGWLACRSGALAGLAHAVRACRLAAGGSTLP
jgi:hypothetical protein